MAHGVFLKGIGFMLRSFTLAHGIPSNVPDSAGPTSHLLTVLVISSPRSVVQTVDGITSSPRPWIP
jgi:hypothetical protein